VQPIVSARSWGSRTSRPRKACEHRNPAPVYFNSLILEQGLSKVHLAITTHLRSENIYLPAAKHREKSLVQTRSHLESHCIDHSPLHSPSTHDTRSCQYKIYKNASYLMYLTDTFACAIENSCPRRKRTVLFTPNVSLQPDQTPLHLAVQSRSCKPQKRPNWRRTTTNGSTKICLGSH
jgi:hypothetical protein